MSEIRKFTFFWDDNTTDSAYGKSPEDAFQSLGFLPDDFKRVKNVEETRYVQNEKACSGCVHDEICIHKPFFDLALHGLGSLMDDGRYTPFIFMIDCKFFKKQNSLTPR